MQVRYLLTVMLVCSGLFFITLLNRLFRIKIQQTRHPGLEGLRGLLAWFVLLHHLSIWYFFLKNNQWEQPPYNLFNHFGNGAVAFFFMITGFLFTSKLLSRADTDWYVFFKNRFLRLFPLYAFSVLLLFALVMYLTGMQLQVSAGRLTDQLLHWLSFTYSGAPDINGYKNSYLLNAGVAWSLRYEIMFYAMIPFLGLLLKIKAGPFTMACSFIVVLLFYLKTDSFNYLLHLDFLAGIVTAFLYKKLKDIRFIKSGFTAVLCCVFLFISVFFNRSSENWLSVLLQSLVFAAIVAGNNFFGLLVAQSTQVLGQLSYSIYLMHGLVLFVVQRCYAEHFFSSSTSFEQYLLAGFVPAFIAVLVSFITYKFIERPFLEMQVKNTRDAG